MARLPRAAAAEFTTPRVSRSDVALRFAGAATVVALFAGALALLLMRWFPPSAFPRLRFPPLFAFSTGLLLLGSWSLSRAIAAVRRERQVLFRRRLLLAVVFGTVFVAVQISSLNWLIQRQVPEEAATGAAAFVIVMAGLHAMHFVVAVWFLIFVTVWAHADRYDHEYHWGVTICVWFWHALSVVWLGVLAVVAIAST
ncbi:MAG TPA: cytochrome c oxidase subunit 3 [Planctomycetaceae bacterium]|jgi:heme/copper-type cytochrome/quinol oxidase subunit 3|nr:cytochrome c oxidase subunit 3 [Planctomycetaceae bacterium]